MSKGLNSIKELITNIPNQHIAYAGGAVLTSIVFKTLKCLVKYCKKYLINKKYKEEAEETLKLRNEKIKKFLEKYKGSITLERIEEISYLTAEELLAKIKQRSITSREACLAYCIKCATIGKELNLICDVDFESAIQQAEDADKKIAEVSDFDKELPYYFGLPLTIKENIPIKGLISTLGAYKFAKRVGERDGYIVRKMKELGAIVLCITNVPQTLFSYEANNRIYGNAQNPWNRERTTGGSSGGDAGLLASHCSALSIGSDIGGSIRGPSSLCGVYGFKPSNFRLSSQDAYKFGGGYHTGWKPFIGSLGPIARSMDDIISFCNNLFGTFNEDTQIIQKAFSKDDFENGLVSSYDPTKKIKIAFAINNKFVEPMGEIKDTLRNIKKSFEEKGYEVVDIDLPALFENVYTMALKTFGPVFGYFREALRGEDPLYFFDYIMQAYEDSPISYFIRKQYYRFKGEYRLLNALEIFREGRKTKNNCLEYIKANTFLDIYKEEFYTYMKKNKIDAIIAPTFPTPAYKIGKSEHTLLLAHYTFYQNILNLVGGTVPIKLCENPTYESEVEDYFTRKIRDTLEGAKGLPISVQVNTMPYQEERCLKIMQEVDSINKYGKNKEIADIIKQKVKSYYDLTKL